MKKLILLLLLSVSALASDYTYKATVVEITDGDTVKVNIDLGFGVFKMNEPIRLNRVYAPEVRGDEKELGLKVKAFLERELLTGGVRLQSIKDKKDKYGRYLGELWIGDKNINDSVLEFMEQNNIESNKK